MNARKYSRDLSALSLLHALVAYIADGHDYRGQPDYAVRLLVHVSPHVLSPDSVLRACDAFGLSHDAERFVISYFVRVLAGEFARVGIDRPLPVKSARVKRPRLVKTSNVIDFKKAAEEMRDFDRALGL